MRGFTSALPRLSVLSMLPVLCMALTPAQSNKQSEQKPNSQESQKAQKASQKAEKEDGQKAQKISGWISDEKSVKKGQIAEHTACAAKCAESETVLVLVTDADKRVLVVDNPDSVRQHAGHHVELTGDVNDKTVHVHKVQMLGQQCEGKSCDRRDACSREHEAGGGGTCKPKCLCSG